MEKTKFQINLEYQQIAELVLQLGEEDLQKMQAELKKMLSGIKLEVTEDKLKNILLEIKKYFNEQLGKYTHKKTSKDWFFYGLGFSSDELGYVFGINIGFFYNSDINLYEKMGMNVLVRTNGEFSEIRQNFLHFFRQNLIHWANTPEKEYFTAERDGKGIEFGRYANLNTFENEQQIISFFKEGIDNFQQIYPKILESGNEIFSKVVRAAPPWKESILELCKKVESNLNL